MNCWLVTCITDGSLPKPTEGLQLAHHCFKFNRQDSWNFANVSIHSSEDISDASRSQLQLINGKFNCGFSPSDRYPEGDFSILSIDFKQQTIRAIIDQLGFQPVFISTFKNGFSISNSLEAICLLPETNLEIDDTQIAVFLFSNMVARNNRTKTPFKNVSRLSYGEELNISSKIEPNQLPKVSSYWKLENESSKIHYPRGESAIDELHSVLKQTVADRVQNSPTGKVGIALSGGLDSTLIAAVASELGAKFTGFTLSHESIHPVDEWPYATLVSQKYNFPHVKVVADEIPFYIPKNWDIDLMRGSVISQAAYLADIMAEYSPIGINGLSADNILDAGLPRMWHPASWGRILEEVRVNKQLPRTGLKSLIVKKPITPEPVPTWVNPDFASEVNINELAYEFAKLRYKKYHPTHNFLGMSIEWFNWSERFRDRLDYEAFDPFFDLRMVRFSLGLDPFVHFHLKKLQRQLAARILPIEIAKRPKTILGDLYTSLLRVTSPELVDLWEAHPDLGKYIQRDLVPHIAGAKLPPRELFNASKAFWLNAWLVGLSEFKKKRLP